MSKYIASPVDGIVASVSGNLSTAYIVHPATYAGHTYSTTSLVSKLHSAEILEAASPNEATRLNELHELQATTLDMFLMFLDSSISLDTKFELAEDLESYFQEDEVRSYVLDVLLAWPLPSGVDCLTAENVASKLTTLKKLVEVISTSQKPVKSLNSAWLSLRDEISALKISDDYVLGVLISAGVFRRVILEAKSPGDLSKLKVSLADECKKSGLPNATIFVKLINEYERLEFGVSKNVRLGDLNRIHASDPEVLCEQYRQKERTQSLQSLLDKIESQVQRSVEFFRIGNDQAGYSILEELIDWQTELGSSDTHVVKTLCNIASKCIPYGRSDVAAVCLRRARKYENAIDSVVFLQIGNLFSDAKMYDDALSCYEHSLLISSGKRTSEIKNAIIRITRLKGQYLHALDQYNSNPNLAFDPFSLTAVGTLYRKMGSFHLARKSYEDALKIDNTYHQAYAGLAETNKQTGRHKKAIRKYEKLLSGLFALDPASHKVYTLALCSSYQFTNNIDLAIGTLKNLHRMYPLDYSVNFQLAKMLLFDGENESASYYFGIAKSRRFDIQGLQLLSEELFSFALGDKSLASNSLLTLRDSIQPEKQGLINCGIAIDALSNGNPKLAYSILDKSVFVDHTEEDFASIIKFHSGLLSGFYSSYTQYPRVARIAKRGIELQRQLLDSIINMDDELIDRFYRRNLLLVA